MAMINGYYEILRLIIVHEIFGCQIEIISPGDLSNSEIGQHYHSSWTA